MNSNPTPRGLTLARGQFYSEVQAAALLGISRPSLRNYRVAGKLNPDLYASSDRPGATSPMRYSKKFVDDIVSGERPWSDIWDPELEPVA